MKKMILITLAAASALAAYFLLNDCCESNPAKDPGKSNRERHLTNAFSKAKAQP